MSSKEIKITSKKVVYSGFNRIVDYSFDFPSFDGQFSLKVEKEIFERRDASAIILFDPKISSIVMIEQFRPGSFIKENIAFPLEIPAGLVDDDCTPEQAAIREAKEETGCVISKIIPISSYYPEISFSTRKIHLFAAITDASAIKNNGGLKCENEDIKIRLIPIDELKTIMEDGKIINSHSLIALQWFFLNFDKIRSSLIN